VSVVPDSYAKDFIHASDRYREWVWVSALIRVETAAGHTILPAGALKDLLLIGVFAD